MRSSLELLLLSLVKDGIATPYELKSQADISVGSTLPALTRLEEDGLIRGTQTGIRNSRRFNLTAKGRTALAKDWLKHVNATPTDIDSIIRIAYLAVANRQPDEASIFLDSAADRLRQMCMDVANEPDQLGGKTASVGVLCWLRTRLESRRLAAQAEELAMVARELRSHSGEPKSRRRKKAKTT